jgi:hypothetical protein
MATNQTNESTLRSQSIGGATDVVNQFHRWLRKDEEVRGKQYRTPISAAVCKDGFCVSIQASEFSYCQPRITADVDYRQFELGFPNMAVPELAEWKDGSDVDDTQTVYGYVPVAVIVALVEKHGGIVGTLVHFRPESQS